MKLEAAARLLSSTPFRLVHGNTIQMTPQQFLKLAMPFGHQGGPQADQSKVDTLSRLPHFDNPMLSVKENAHGELQVALHDGRHRALAAIQRGDTKLNVDIVRGRKYAREHPDVSDADLAAMVIERGVLSELGS